MRKTRGFSLIELLMVVAIILIIAAIAIPNILRARMLANESAAAANMKNIRDAQGTYMATYGASVGFADALTKLGPGPPGSLCDELHACVTDVVLGCNVDPCKKSNYLFYMVSATTGPVIDYTVTATPVGWATTGRRNMCVFDDGLLRQEIAPTASLSGALTRTECGTASRFEPLK
jgi:type IV pilus assembly protein PilA